MFGKSRGLFFYNFGSFYGKLGEMKKDKWKKEVEWLIKDKYNGSMGEVTLQAYLRDDLSRLKQGEPIDYIIGWREFLGCQIDLSERPLIPREETEFWVKILINDLKQEQMEARPPFEVLDIFAGSGCIGLAVMKNCPKAKVVFADKEEKCVRQIKKNLKLNKLSGQVKKSDLFSNISKKFDLIVANPPYIPVKGQRVSKSVQDWEPSTALYGGESGLVVIEKFLKQAQSYLKPRGKIYLEFGFGQKLAIEKLLKQFKYKKWQFHKDQFGKFRWVVV